MNSFAFYNKELGAFADEMLELSPQMLGKMDFSRSPHNSQYLNKQLRSLISIDELRSAGSFFTCDVLSKTAATFFTGNLAEAKLVFDPACGVGNLLIACSKTMPISRNSLVATLTDWGNKLAGFDIHKEFIKTTKLRLILEATKRGAYPDSKNIEHLKSLFSMIYAQDSLKNSTVFADASHIIINPPYCKINLLKSCVWGQGSGNSAAVFMEHCFTRSSANTQIVAILPDVLRSGSRYKKWRNFISENANIKLKTIGRFDSKTDVDVFLLHGKAGSESIKQPTWIKNVKNSTHKTIEDLFYISTGPIVPFRDKEEGPEFCYISPSTLKGQIELHTKNINSRRKYSGKVVAPPFVVVRRTSSPSDLRRARATLINGAQVVAVENHLLILKPKSGHIRDCKKLLKVLATNETNEFLNQRIRCRHLTVSSIKEIPWLGVASE